MSTSSSGETAGTDAKAQGGKPSGRPKKSESKRTRNPPRRGQPRTQPSSSSTNKPPLGGTISSDEPNLDLHPQGDTSRIFSDSVSSPSPNACSCFNLMNSAWIMTNGFSSLFEPTLFDCIHVRWLLRKKGRPGLHLNSVALVVAPRVHMSETTTFPKLASRFSHFQRAVVSLTKNRKYVSGQLPRMPAWISASGALRHGDGG